MKIRYIIINLAVLLFIASRGYGWVLPPVAVLDAEPNDTTHVNTVTLVGSGSYDPDSDIIKYEWDFTNDGTYDYTETASSYPDGTFDGNTTHTYTEAGTYTALLRVTDAGATDTDTTTVTIRPVVYYVDPNGDDSSDGSSWTNAIKTIKHAIEAADTGTVDCYDIIDINSGTYVTVPIDIMDNDYIRLSFQENVVVRAKSNNDPCDPNTFSQATDKLMMLRDCEGWIFDGNDTIFEMNKSEYSSGEWRHALALYSCNDVEIRKMTFRDSGGDGIVVGNFTGKPPSQNILVQDVICDNNRRDSLSITGVNDIVVERCIFRNANGTNPQAGIDIESHDINDVLTNIVIRDVLIEENVNSGLVVTLNHLSQDTFDVNMVFENIYISGRDKYSPDFDRMCEYGIYVANLYDTGPSGSIEFKNVTVEDVNYGLRVSKSKNNVSLTFEDCVWLRINDFQENGVYRSPIQIDSIWPDANLPGGVDFNSCQIFDDVNRPAIRYAGYDQYTLYDVTGDLYVYNTVRDSNLADWSEANDVNNVTLTMHSGVLDFCKAYRKPYYNWYSSIQGAMNDCNSGDVIRVSPCVHYETVDFNGVSCTLTSIDPNDWSAVENTIIDANSIAVVILSDAEDANTILTGLTLQNATGYGVFMPDSNATISNCIIKPGEPNAEGIYTNASPTIKNNKISESKFGIYSFLGIPTIKNNWIYQNDSGILSRNNSIIRNNTIVNNTTAGIRAVLGGSPVISNCIIWGNTDDLDGCSATYSCIEDANSGTGNISSDPCFVDADANDFYLRINSPCVDTGDPNGSYSGEVDIEGENRVLDGDDDGNSVVDMGADEMYTFVYNITQDTFYATIQAAIDDACDGDVIELLERTYYESARFAGKAITLRSKDPNDWDVVAATIIDANSTSYAIMFNSNEDSNSVLSGVTLRGGDGGVRCKPAPSNPIINRCIMEKNGAGISCWGTRPEISNCKIRTNNGRGIICYGGGAKIKNNLIYGNENGMLLVGIMDTEILNNTIVYNKDFGIDKFLTFIPEPNISNCILWGNSDDMNSVFSAVYSCIEDVNDANGEGNITSDPCFANACDFIDKCISDGTTTTIVVSDASLYDVNDVIEYYDDGVVRTVTDVNTATNIITFSNALDASSVFPVHIFNWGIGATDLEEDFRIDANSLCIDAGDGDKATDEDFLDNSRYDDPNTTNTGTGDPNYVDMGAYEYQG